MKYTIIRAKDQDVRLRLGGTVVRCYSEKKMREMYPDRDYSVVGEIKSRSKKQQIGELSTGQPVSQWGTHSVALNREVGYIPVGGNEYLLALRTRAVLPILVGVLVALALAAAAWFLLPGLLGGNARPDPVGDAQVGDRQEMADIPQDEQQEEKLEDRISFAGYGKATVSEERPNIELKNPDVNTVDFVFTISDKATGEVLAVTDSVAPGQYAYVEVYQHFKGTEGGVLTINTATFAPDNTPRNGMNSEVEIEVK